MKQALAQIFCIALLLGGTLGCGSYVPVVEGDNMAYLYGKGASVLGLDARIYRPDAEHALIYFRLRTADLLYKGEGGGGPYHARATVKYEAFLPTDPKRLLDSASTFIKDQRMGPEENKALIGSMALKITGNAPFMIRVTAHDLNRDVQGTLLLRLDPGPAGIAQQFLPLDTNGIPLFEDRLPPGTSVRLQSEAFAGTLLHVAHYPPFDQLPPPVFAEASPPALNVPPDSTFLLPIPPAGRFPFTIGSTGSWHFRPDTASNAGYTLFMAPEGYPAITTATDMVAPLRYITSQKEWETFAKAPDQRKEVERFWTDAAGNRQRAREAIAAYYGRVETANRYFSSYTEGWKTDRGLVYIIFGPPTTIRRDPAGETWIYGDEANLMSLVFRFVARNDPFSTNDLVLQRDPQLKSAWYRNVESWRNGRIMQY